MCHSMDNLAIMSIVALVVLSIIVFMNRCENFVDADGTERDIVPLKKGMRFFPGKKSDEAEQGPQACRTILGGGWSYTNWAPAANKRDGGVYNCFRTHRRRH